MGYRPIRPTEVGHLALGNLCNPPCPEGLRTYSWTLSRGAGK
jgi:hypothetical protein